MKDKITSKDLLEARVTFEYRIETLDPDRKAALALSGGTDSVTILFSMLATGRKPRCYTFHVEGIESTDLQSARAITKHFGLELVEVTIPTDVNQIVSDIKSYLDQCEVIKKTVIQCLHPWLYLYPAMVKNGDFLVLNGLGGDDLYCNQRKVQVMLHKEGEAGIAQYRKTYSDNLSFSAANIIRWGQKEFNIKNIDFYACKEIEEFFLKFTVKSLHKPVEKFLTAGPFKDFYDQGRFYRKHESYQINSGLKLAHESLLNSHYNQRDAKDVLSIYNDIKAGKV